MTEQLLPFFIAGQRVGFVQNITSHSGFSRGELILDSSNDMSPIQAAVSLARQVDRAPPSEYSVAWQAWRGECKKIQNTGIWIGSTDASVEEFSIESDWSIEWQNALADDFFDS